MADSNKIREQLHRILDIVLDGNGLECRTREKTGTMPTLFFRYSGHVANMEVELYPDGWASGASHSSFDFYTDCDIDDEKIDSLAAAITEALGEKKESDVLRKDIAAREEEIKYKRENLTAMKKRLKQLERIGA